MRYAVCYYYGQRWRINSGNSEKHLPNKGNAATLFTKAYSPMKQYIPPLT